MNANRVVAILSVVGVAFVVLLGGGTAVYHATSRLLDIVVAAVVLATWSVIALRRPDLRPRSSLTPVLVLVPGVFAISAVSSASPRIGLEYAGWVALLAALYLLLVTLLRDPVVRSRILVAVPLLCLVISVAYITIVMADWVAWWHALGRLAPPPLRPRIEGLTYANPSTVMTMLMLLLASSTAILGTRGRRGTFLVALVVLAAIASFLTGSRGGLIGLAAGLGAIVVAGLALDRDRIGVIVAGARRLRAAAFSGLVAIVALGAVFGPEILGRLTASGGDLRVSYAMASLRGFLESPATGIGPGMWAIDRLRLSVESDGDRYVPHAHNIIAQTIGEFGVLGVIAGLVALVFVARVVRSAFGSPGREVRPWGYAAVFSLAYLAGHQQVDLFANAPAVIFAGAFPLAVLDASASSGGSRRDGAATAVIVAAALVATQWLAAHELNAIRYEAGVRAADSGDWDRAMAGLRTVVETDPTLGVHQLALGLAEARAGDLGGAGRAFAAAAAIDDYPVSWLNLAAVQARLGDGDAARDSLDRAYRLGRQHPMTAFGIGEVRLELDDRVGAIEAFGQTLALAPTLAGDPGWTDRPELTAIVRPALDLAYERIDPWRELELALAVGDLERADRVASALSAPTARLIVDAATDPPRNLAALIDHADRNPADLFAAGWTMRIATATGDTTTAERLRSRAQASSTFGAIEGRVVRMHDAVRPGILLVNESNVLHGLYTYRRPTPQDYLVPWLTKLAYR